MGGKNDRVQEEKGSKEGSGRVPRRATSGGAHRQGMLGALDRGQDKGQGQIKK